MVTFDQLTVFLPYILGLYCLLLKAGYSIVGCACAPGLVPLFYQVAWCYCSFYLFHSPQDGSTFCFDNHAVGFMALNDQFF